MDTMSCLNPASELEHFDGLSLIYWTLMGPYGIDRVVHSMEFTDCENGLGIKVMGGVKELTGEEFGVYVKRILPGGLASIDGNLQAGDQILEVNGESLIGVTSERAVDILRSASSTNHMRLLIARDEEGRREFTELLEKYGSHSSTSSARNSPIQHGRYLDSTSSGSSSRSQSPLLLSPAGSQSTYNNTPIQRSLSHLGEGVIQLISITRSSTLGISISGGSNRSDGPAIYIQEVLSGGDCHRDGRLRPGDQLIAIGKESLIGLTFEEAKTTINKFKFSQEPQVEIAYIRGKGPAPSVAFAHGGGQRAAANGYAGSRFKVHPRPPEQIRAEEPGSMRSSSPDVCPPDIHVSASQRTVAFAKPKVSLDPHIRLKSEKIDLALSYLGLDFSEEKRQRLRETLSTDLQGTVSYGDFVEATSKVYHDKLEETGLAQGPFLFSYHEAASLMDTSAFHSPTYDSECSYSSEEAEQWRCKVKQLHLQMKQLKGLLEDTEHSKKSLEEQLQKTTEKATATVEENKTLKSRLQVAEAVPKKTSAAGQDYGEVIRLLEAEVKDLKEQLADRKRASQEGPQEAMVELNKKLSAIDSQLRKSELTRKHLETSNKKLLSFTQNVHKYLTSGSLIKMEKNWTPKSPSAKETPDTPALVPDPAYQLVAEAKELVDTVCSLHVDDHTLPQSSEVCIIASECGREPSRRPEAPPPSGPVREKEYV